MGLVRKAVVLRAGLFTVAVNVHSSAPTRQTNVNVCLGVSEQHAPTPVRQQRVCETCGPVGHRDLHSARPVGDGFAILDPEVKASSAATADEKNFLETKSISTRELEEATDRGSKRYYLTPSPGHEDAYWAMVAVLSKSRSSVALVARWAVRSVVADYRVVVRHGVLMIEELVAAESLLPPPEITPGGKQVASLARALGSYLTADAIISSYEPPMADPLDAIIAGLPIMRSPAAVAAADETAGLLAALNAAVKK